MSPVVAALKAAVYGAGVSIGDRRGEPPPDAAHPGDRIRSERTRPLSVSQVIRAAGLTLDEYVGTIWVEGEVAALTQPSSGHLYFALSDRQSQLRCVMWRSDVQRLRFRLENGLKLRCRGRLGIYERDGKFQFYAQLAEPAGLGADALALEQLRAKLAAEGLFDPARKQPLPVLPRQIGVVTSRTGAAVRDIIRAVQRRFPVPILVADTRVQGAGAANQIVNALRLVYRAKVDVIILGRGGGSASDLAVFNEETVVRAVSKCPIPIISAVGHEIDTTLTDLVADRRAATPTMAGEMAVPVLSELAEALAKEEHRLRRELSLRIASGRQQVDQLAEQAHTRVSRCIATQRHAISELGRRLEVGHPRAQLTRSRAELRDLHSRSLAALQRTLSAAKHSYASLAGRLDSMSPLRVLERGYAIATTAEGHVIADAAVVEPGDAVAVRLHRGHLECRVDAVHPTQPSGEEGD